MRNRMIAVLMAMLLGASMLAPAAHAAPINGILPGDSPYQQLPVPSTSGNNSILSILLGKIGLGSSGCGDLIACQDQTGSGGAGNDLVSLIINLLSRGGSSSDPVPPPLDTQMPDPNRAPGEDVTTIPVGIGEPPPTYVGDPSTGLGIGDVISQLPSDSSGNISPSSPLPSPGEGLGGAPTLPGLPSQGDLGNLLPGGFPISANASFQASINGPQVIQCVGDLDPKNPIIEDKISGEDVTFRAACVSKASVGTVEIVPPLYNVTEKFTDAAEPTREFPFKYTWCYPDGRGTKCENGTAVVKIKAKVALASSFSGSGNNGDFTASAQTAGSISGGGLIPTGGSSGLSGGLPSANGLPQAGQLSGGQPQPGQLGGLESGSVLPAAAPPISGPTDTVTKLVDAVGSMANMASVLGNAAGWGGSSPHINVNIPGISEGFGMLSDNWNSMMVSKLGQQGLKSTESGSGPGNLQSSQTPDEVRRDKANIPTFTALIGEAQKILASRGVTMEQLKQNPQLMFEDAGFLTKSKRSAPGWYVYPVYEMGQ